MSESTDKRADTTRQQILQAAAHQFAQRPYYEVGLDDILAEAGLTKGAMYFHFRSKHALALAIIEEQTAKYIAAAQDLLTRKFSGLEALIDAFYQIAVGDVGENGVRAGLHLLESVGRTDARQTRQLGNWVELYVSIAHRAVAEGDIVEECDPQSVGRLLVSLYMGLRQTSNLDEPEQFLRDVDGTWALVLRAIVPPDRLAYFSQFVRRRTALAIKAASPGPLA